MYNPELEIYNWLLKLLGMVYIEEKIGSKLENDKESRQILDDAKRTATKHIKELYESCKENPEIRESPFFKTLKGMLEKEDGEIEKARKLLESKGYSVEKER